MVELYQVNNIPIDTTIVKKLYGENINFTLNRFINITKDKEELQKYFKEFRRVKNLMLLKADGLRTYMPTTFDETMVEFGSKLERKRVLDEIDKSLKLMELQIKKNEPCLKACD